MAVEPTIIPAATPAAEAPIAPAAVAPAVPVSTAPAPLPVTTEVVPSPTTPPGAVEPPPAEPPKQASLLQQFDAEAKAKEPAKVEEPPKVEEPKVEAKVEEKPVEPKVEEPAKVEEPKTEEPKVEAKPEPREVKFDYKLPEGISLPDAMRDEMHGALTNFLTDPNAASQQALVDWHLARVQDGIKAYHEDALRQFNEYNAAEQKKFKNHPVLGGRAFNTTMASVAAVRDAFISDHRPGSKGYEADMARWNDWDNRTGAGNSSIWLEVMHRISRYMGEPEMRGSEEIRPIIQAELPGGRPSIYKTSFKNR